MFKTWQTQQNAFIFRNPNLHKHTISMLNLHKHTLSVPNVTIHADPHMLQCKQSFWQALLLIWLGKHFHPNPVVTDRCFRDRGAVLNTYKPPKRQTRNHHTWGHHMSQCTRQTPPTLLYSNEQLWMPFSYSDGIDTDVGFADNTNASSGRTYHSRSFNTGSTDVKTSQNKGERTENTARPAYLRKAMTLLVHYYNWEFDTNNNVQSKRS